MIHNCGLSTHDDYWAMLITCSGDIKTAHYTTYEIFHSFLLVHWLQPRIPSWSVAVMIFQELLLLVVFTLEKKHLFKSKRFLMRTICCLNPDCFQRHQQIALCVNNSFHFKWNPLDLTPWSAILLMPCIHLYCTRLSYHKALTTILKPQMLSTKLKYFPGLIRCPLGQQDPPILFVSRSTQWLATWHNATLMKQSSLRLVLFWMDNHPDQGRSSGFATHFSYHRGAFHVQGLVGCPESPYARSRYEY